MELNNKNKETLERYGMAFGLGYLLDKIFGGLLFWIFDVILGTFIGQERAAEARQISVAILYFLLATVGIWWLSS